MGMKAWKQIEAGSVRRNLLEAPVQAELDQIAVNTGGIAAINSARGAASGIATLDAGGKVPQSQIPAVALSEYKGDVADAAAMTALTAQQGDWCTRQDEGVDYILSGSDSSVAADWRPISSPNNGVTSVNGNTGAVTLAAAAFSGAAADISGLADIATSGSANDASYDGSATNYLAGDTSAGAALTTLDAKAKQNADAIVTAKGAAVNAATLVNGTLTGVQDDANPTFTVSGVDTSKKILFFRDGIEQLTSGFATISGDTITTVISNPASDEAMVVVGYPAAA